MNSCPKNSTTGQSGFPLSLIARSLAGSLLVSGVYGLSGCATPVLEPQGPAAAKIAEVWWVLLGVTAAIFIAVMVLFVIALHRNHAAGDQEKAHRFARSMTLWGGALIPAIVVVGLMTHMVLSLRDLEEPEIAPGIVVRVTGHDWWWEVNYEEPRFETANEIHLPVGEPVRFLVGSHDVIHSFWVPALQGKVDMLPASTSSLWLQADNVGVYDGFCAEFCGLQHARMHFVVVAEPREAFDAWLQSQAESAQQPEGPAAGSLALFLDAGCGTCHTINGTEATGTLGPDLTHVASRKELGAGTLQNSLVNLSAWILDSQAYKPGNMMPSFSHLSGEQLQVLTTFLQEID